MPADDERARDDVDARPAGTPPEHALLDQLRDANEQLVVSSIRAQELVDDAEASRAAADVSRVAAEAANRLKDEFLAVVSHELRNPLNVVLGWARLLRGGQLDPGQTKDAVGTIERNARALARIIDDLLDVSRIIGGNLRIEAQPVDLVAVVQAAISEAQPGAEAKAQRLTFAYSMAPGPVVGDAGRLQQVIANLLFNAVKFTPASGRVEVTLIPSHTHADVRVTDTGQGIGADFLPHIFDRFSQADASPTRRHGGLGLGLSIVRALVEQHGGTVTAESPGPGRGATFTVRLPVLSAERTGDPEQPAIDETGAAATSRPLDNIRVLLVEDDVDGREMLSAILTLAGATVVAASSVREALAKRDTSQPDVIVSDIGMPDEDGLVLIRAIRAREVEGIGTPIPAIALTGYAGPEDRARVLAAGFQTHMSKPVEPHELLAAVASLMATRDGWS